MNIKSFTLLFLVVLPFSGFVSGKLTVRLNHQDLSYGLQILNHGSVVFSSCLVAGLSTKSGQPTKTQSFKVFFYQGGRWGLSKLK